MKNLQRLLSLDHSFHGCLIDLMASEPTGAELDAIDTIFQRLTDAYTDFRATIVPADGDGEEHDPNRTEIITQEVAHVLPAPVADEVVSSIAMDPVPEEQLLGEPHSDEEAESLNRVIDISRELLSKYASFTDKIDKKTEEGEFTESDHNIIDNEAEDNVMPAVEPEAEVDTVEPTAGAEEASLEAVNDILAKATDHEVEDSLTEIDELQAESDEYISLDDLSTMEMAASMPSASDAAIRVDEMLSRRSTADLRKAFTLNDKYRFRRELFGNSDAAMTDALNVIAAMHSGTEAEEYLYGDLGWDEMQPDVKDFMAVVKSHFETK